MDLYQRGNEPHIKQKKKNIDFEKKTSIKFNLRKLIK